MGVGRMPFLTPARNAAGSSSDQACLAGGEQPAPYMESIGMKVCTKCGLSKPRSQFQKNPSMRDGLRSDCKACAALRFARYYGERAAEINITRKQRLRAMTEEERAEFNQQRRRDAEAERARYLLNIEHERARSRDYYARPESKKRHAEATARRRARNPKQFRARHAVKKAVLKGLIRPLPCFVCGEPAEAHHPDYDRPLDVVWLCRAHHRQAHMLARRRVSTSTTRIE